MSRFERQERIDGWNQQKLRDAHVAVADRGSVGTFLVWALCSMGVGKVVWIGSPKQHTQNIATWLLSDSESFEDSSILELPFDPHYDGALEWGAARAGGFPTVCIDASEREEVRAALSRVFVQRHGAVLLAGGTAGGGWIVVDGAMIANPGDSAPRACPSIAMAVAALLADATRSLLCPLPSDIPALGGSLGWQTTDCGATQCASALLVGAGGIGVWAATVLALRGHELFIADSDHVEPSNLPRQGLFTAADALEQANKALAASDRLRVLFPQAKVHAIPKRIDASFFSSVLEIRPTAILSAVDNADSRLILQEFGFRSGIPVIQAGTDISCADCFTQVPDGTALDDQMHGALAAAARREAAAGEDRGRCAVNPSWIVPVMLAGAMLSFRFEQCAGGPPLRAFPPIRWRQGDCPRAIRSPFDELNAEVDH